MINEVCRRLRGDFERWQDRSFETHKVMYLFLDGTYLKLRPEDKRAIAVLCAYGMTWDGRKVLLHLAVGDKESFPAAMKCLEQDLEESLTALRFPLVHRVRIRTTNLLNGSSVMVDGAPKSSRDSLPTQAACLSSSQCWPTLRKDGEPSA